MTSKEGFSVVAPIRMMVPSSTCGRKASCWALLNRWISSINNRVCWLIENVYFDFDKSNIKSEFIPILVEVADVMKQNPGLTVRVEGHTDSLGTMEYNEKLSEKRAMAAKQYLLDQGISKDRISTASFGHSMPAATNDTEWGRAENRRDEFKWTR